MLRSSPELAAGWLQYTSTVPAAEYPVYDRATAEAMQLERMGRLPEAGLESTPQPELVGSGSDQVEAMADACMLYSSSPGIDHRHVSESPGANSGAASPTWCALLAGG